LRDVVVVASANTLSDCVSRPENGCALLKRPGPSLSLGDQISHGDPV
jgi:hypothetical protein